MKKIIFIYLGTTLLFSCGSEKEKTESTDTKSEKEFFFKEVAAITSGNEELILPEGYTYQVLFQGEKDSVVKAGGSKHPAKEDNDMLAYLPIDGSSEHGFLYISHETYDTNSVLGDGGGGSIMEIKKENGNWNIIDNVKHVDFSGVGETSRNCGGTPTPFGTILTCEEMVPMNNAELSYNGKAFSDTSDLSNGIKAFENQGWMVEVDPKTNKAIHKIYAMGRYMHEDAHCMPDNKTVYLSDDNDPAVFFKFVADDAKDYTKGQLYAFQQTETAGNWIEIPRDTNSLINARSVAIELGATLYMRHEWMDLVNGKLYISETGKDRFEWAEYTATATPAPQFNNELMKISKDGVGEDPYGRILEFNPETNEMRVFLEGGTAKNDSTKNFSNPDCIVKLERGEKTYLVMSEDLVGTTQNRISKEAMAAGEKYCEIYMLDMSIEKPTVDDLVRFAVAPNGSETTGDCFTPDGKTMFLNVQHPSSSNKEPFNCSTTIAIEGF